MRHVIEVKGSILFDQVLVDPYERVKALGYQDHEERIRDLVPKAAEFCAAEWYLTGDHFCHQCKDGRRLILYRIFCPKAEAVCCPPEDLILFCVVGHSSSLRGLWRKVALAQSYKSGVHLWVLGARYATAAEKKKPTRKK